MASNEAERFALVTGANRGIGFEIARGLASRGFRVLAGVRSKEKAVLAAEDFATAKLGAKVVPVVLDIANAASIPERLGEIERAHGPIDVLVNNAAILIDA
ncbi:MAG: SDR family NAD(P)-dependent oxidoreductase, partial [Hyphomicrobium sp.]